MSLCGHRGNIRTVYGRLLHSPIVVHPLPRSPSCQLVTTNVIYVVCMALDPDASEHVAPRGPLQILPEIGIDQTPWKSGNSPL